VDVRSIRYPGLISYKADPGGGTTDYAIDIFKQGLLHGSYTSFLSENTYLPMMYMDDAVRGTLELMDTDPDKIQTRSSYNLGAMSFSPSQLAAEIRKYLPGFIMNYSPDFRQAIADSWPDSINDDAARNEWGWDPHYDIQRLTTAMIDGMKPLLKHQSV
jgi:nucleoside-diphosphate-sugar epimerase